MWTEPSAAFYSCWTIQAVRYYELNDCRAERIVFFIHPPWMGTMGGRSTRIIWWRRPPCAPFESELHPYWLIGTGRLSGDQDNRRSLNLSACEAELQLCFCLITCFELELHKQTESDIKTIFSLILFGQKKKKTTNPVFRFIFFFLYLRCFSSGLIFKHIYIY